MRSHRERRYESWVSTPSQEAERLPGWPATMSQTDSQVVLLIEDHRDTREMYAEMLHHAGFAVIEVSTAERALRLLNAVLPDVIVTDLKMPGMGGLELIRRLREEADWKHLPVIAVAAISDSTETKAHAAGCTVFLQKPCLPEAVVLAVRRVATSGHPSPR